MTYAEDIIQQGLKEAKSRIAKNRRDERRNLLDYYTGTYTQQYIDDYFKPDQFREIPFYNTNVTRKFINKMSRIYTVGASRNVSDQYNALTYKKDARFKHLERMTRLLGSVAVQVTYNPYATKPCFDYRPIYMFEVFLDDYNPFEPKAIIYPVQQNVADLSDTKQLEYVYWDSEVYCLHDAHGNIIEEFKHGYGRLPFVFLHKENQIDDFRVEGATDIVSCNEQVNITMTELQLGLRFQMFGTPYVTGVYADSKIERVGTDRILDLPEGATFDIASPGGNIESVIENVKFQLELVALNNHMYVQFAQDGGETPSGIALRIKDLEFMEDYEDDKALWMLYEKDFYELEKIIGKANGINLPEEIGIDYNEVEYPQSVQDEISMNTYFLENNLTTQAKLLKKYNDDLTIEEAQAIVDENKEINGATNGKNEEPKQSIFGAARDRVANTQ